jgi:hypothetical protein
MKLGETVTLQALACYSLVFSGRNIENIFMFSSFVTERLKSGLNQGGPFFFIIFFILFILFFFFVWKCVEGSLRF